MAVEEVGEEMDVGQLVPGNVREFQSDRKCLVADIPQSVVADVQLAKAG